MALGLAIVVVVFATGPVVRRGAQAAAAAANVTLGIGRVRPGFFAVVLEDVAVAPAGEPGISLVLPEVRVALSARLRPSRVEAHAGELVVEGPPAEVKARLERWRARREPPRGTASKGPERQIVVDGLRIRWTAPEGSLEISGASLVLEPGTLELRAEQATLRRAPVEVVARGVALELDPERRLRALRADAVGVVLTMDTPARPADPPAPAPSTAAAVAPALPLEPRAPKGGKPAKAAPNGLKVEPGVSPGDAFTPMVPLPNLSALRGRISFGTQAVAELLPQGSEVRVGALSIDVRGPTPVSIGPGPLNFLRHQDLLALSFKSGGAVGSPPLSLDLHSPIGAGEPSLTIEGGPLPLSLLGLREGALGLVDLAHATVFAKGRVLLDAAGTSATFDGELRLAGGSLNQPRLARETLRELTLGVAGRGLLTSTTVRLDDGHVTLGKSRVDLRGTLEQDATHLQASVALELPTVPCQELVSSVPAGLMPTLRGVRFAGTFTGRARLAFDTRNLDALDLDYTVDDRCRATEVPAHMARERFTTVFTHATTHPDGSRGEARTGPGSGNWTELGGISPFLPVAVTTTEDGSFFRHHGFNHWAIKQSFVANVKARRFVRGASTITMQLAKNLFLVREKTLSRKLEEIVLAAYLEQAFRKDDLLELYLNVVEFGPDVYGVTQASAHYFGRTPLELNLSESLFLATLLPSPVKSHHLAEHDELPEHWQKHLQALMRIAERTHRISPAELEEGLKERVTFYKAGSPRPAPRVTARSRADTPLGGAEGELDWRSRD